MKPHGAGYTHAWSPEVDSVLAAQLAARATRKLSAIVQVVSQQNADGGYRPHLEWANVKYEFTPDFSVRVGRTVIPTFLLSETRNVGYTFPWVRPPAELYHLNPLTTSDGVDVRYRLRLGKWANTVQGNFGRNDVTPAGSGEATRIRGAWGIFDTLESGPLTLRGGYQRGKVTVPSINALFDAFRQFGPQGVALAETYDVDAKPNSFIAAGASYDPGPWFATSEWGRFESHSVLGASTAWYLSGGARFGKLTPFVTYARARPDNLSDPGLDATVLPAFLAETAAGLNVALNSILSTKPRQDTVTVGGRWDLLRNAALKLQFAHTQIEPGSSGVLSNLQPDYELGGEFNALSASVDFVF